MILKLVAPLLKLLLPKVTENVADNIAKMFKLPQLLDHMELPNATDRKLDKVEARVDVMVSEFREFKEALEGVERMLKKFGK